MFNDYITVYKYINNEYIREVIPEVFYDECRQSNVNKSGLTNADSATVIIPSYTELYFTEGRDLLIKGIIDYEFDNTSAKTQAESKRELDKLGKVLTITSVDSKLHGGLANIQLGCK